MDNVDGYELVQTLGNKVLNGFDLLLKQIPALLIEGEDGNGFIEQCKHVETGDCLTKTISADEASPNAVGFDKFNLTSYFGL